mmetsp:Transcript_788/g.2032  ORF Transcript_788/g.2032 Transcript_788/m.2032 type:complete len:569 (+) Transcript_788:68-1774(+)
MAFRSHALERNYHYEYALGLWSFGSVQVIKDRRTNKLKMCKKVRKECVRNMADAMARLHRLRDLQHEHICAITDIEEEQGCIYIIYDKCHGGDIADWITRVQEEGNWLQERTVAEYMRQTLVALAFAHGARASHRDLQPSSLALSSKLPDAKIMVADIGLAEILNPQDEVVDYMSSPYAAPELRTVMGLPQPGSECALADMWSVGAIAHQLLVGVPPPKPDGIAGPWNAISRSGLVLCREQADAWDSRSDLSRDFVKRLLKSKASDRPTAAAMLQHPWIQSCYPVDLDLWHPDSASLPDLRSRLMCYLLAVLLLPVSAQYREVFQLRSAFAASDIDRDGLVPAAVARRLLRDKGALPSDADAALDAVDVTRTGVVDLCALLAAWLIARSFCGIENGEPRCCRPADLSQRLLRGFFRAFGDAQRGVTDVASISRRHDAVVAREVEMHAGVRYDELIACLPDEDAFGAEALAAAISESQGRGTPLAVGEGGDHGEESELSWGDAIGLERVQDLIKNVFQTCGFTATPRGRWDGHCEVVSLHTALTVPYNNCSKDMVGQQRVHRRVSGSGP